MKTIALVLLLVASVVIAASDPDDPACYILKDKCGCEADCNPDECKQKYKEWIESDDDRKKNFYENSVLGKFEKPLDALFQILDEACKAEKAK